MMKTTGSAGSGRRADQGGRRRRKTSGFTMVELIIVVLVLAVMASIGYPRLADHVARTRVDNAALVIAGDLRQAVALASRQGTPVRIDFDATAMRYSLTDRGSGDLLFARPIGTDSELALGSASFSSSTIDVFPNRVTSAQLNIRLGSGRHASQVSMSSAAFIRVVRP